jgi:hypothetical protein
MPEWSRNTPWRQGHALASKSGVALGLLPEQGADTDLLLLSGFMPSNG